jgi:hypothetical protein
MDFQSLLIVKRIVVMWAIKVNYPADLLRYPEPFDFL